MPLGRRGPHPLVERYLREQQEREIEEARASAPAPASSSGSAPAPASSSSSAPAPASSSSSAPASGLGAGGGAVITTDTDMTLDPIPEWEAPEIASEFAPQAFEQSGEALDSFEQTIKGLHDVNQAWLKGEISGDVADQLRQQSRLSSRMGGVGEDSQMSRNLQARDFGTTSMQIQQQGVQQEAVVGQMQQGLAGIREQRSQFMQDMLERSRQFGASHEQDATRTQLMHKELMLKQDAFNAEQNLRLVQLISEATMSMTGQQVQAAMGDVSDSGITASFNTLMKQLEDLLSRSNTR